VTPEQFWRLHPVEFWWLMDAHKGKRVYGRKHHMTGVDVENIVRDLRAKGLEPRWQTRRK
jgi:hypothetical protein